MSLRTKLILTHSLIAVLAVSLAVIFSSRVIDRYFRQLADIQARNYAAELARPLGRCYETNNGWHHGLSRCLIHEALVVASRPGNRRVVVFDTQGLILFDAQRGELEEQTVSPMQRQKAVPIVAFGQVVGGVTVVPEAGTLGPAEDRFIATVRRTLLLTGIGGILLALTAGAMVAQGLTKPLRELTRAAYGLAQGERNLALTPSPAHDEVGELSRAFTTMSSALEHSEGLRRQMVADIAHELRTPLAVLQLELESLEDGIAKPTPERLASLSEEVQLLSRLIGDLRTLSLADAGQLSLQREALDPATLTRRMAGRIQQQARERTIHLDTTIAPELPDVYADADRLQQVLGNVLDNALRHTPAGGTITLEVSRHSDGLCWSIVDTGPGFSHAEAQAIFDRFIRTDAARARDTGGSGLGLAIVRSLVQSMDGRVWAEPAPGGGAAFFIVLPAA